MPSESSTHRIRLRGPWEYAWLDGSAISEFLAVETVTMPASWQKLFGKRAGTALFRRRFNRPSNLGPEQRVRIVLSQVRGEAILRLNGKPVVVAADADEDEELLRGDVTDQLRDFNLLEVQLRCDQISDSDGPAGLWKVVILEITE